MKRETRTVVYDDDLRIEAYRFEGLAQPFPNHFHEYYVIGFVEDGVRILSCKNEEYTVKTGDVLLFNPGDNHACVQSGGGALDYRGFNIAAEIMRKLALEITGHEALPSFSPNVICGNEVACYLRPLHEAVMGRSPGFDKEEWLLLMLSLLIQKYACPFERHVPDCRKEIERACAFMERHYAQRISLEQICRHAGASKSTLLRAFTKAKGVTPYSYLQNLRVGKAKKLLEHGVPPARAALLTGFSDQSHFTNYFNRFIGLTPGAYREIFKTMEDIPHES